MPRIKISSLPKYVLGGPPICPTGQMPDPNNPGECIDDPNYVASTPSTVPRVDNGKKNNYGNSITGNFSKNYEDMTFSPTISTAGMTGGTNFNIGNTDISGNSIAPAVPTNLEAEQTYTLDPNQTGPKVGLFECPKGYSKDKNGKCVKKKGFFGDMTTAEKLQWGVNTVGSLLTAGNIWATDKANRERKKAFDKQFRYAQFNPALNTERDKGNWTADSQRTFQPNMQPPVNEGMMNRQFGGMVPGQKPNTVKIKIVDSPESAMMKYGGQFEGSYGLDVGWRNLYTDMAKTSSDHYGNTLSEQKKPKSPYVLEAEGEEVIYKPGDRTSHIIKGPDHSRGGVKLTDEQVSSKVAPDVSSFIFSKTKGMAIKDPEVLARFGITTKSKGGVVPAKIAKKFELNKYKAIIEDPTKDDLAKRTAAMMLDNNERYLAELAVVHEEMKGKEAPEFAESVLSRGQNSAQYGGWISKSENLRKFVGGGDAEDDPDSAPNDINPWAGDKSKKSKYYRKGPKSNASKYTKEDWKNKLRALGFNGPWNNLAVQKFLYTIPEAQAIIDKYHGTGPEGMGQPAGGMFDEILGRRWDEALEAIPAKKVDTVPGETIAPKVTIKPGVAVDAGQEKTKFICITDPNTGTKIVPAVMGYDTEEEARANCGKTATPPPFDFTTPDKLAMAAAAAVFPRKDYPTIANKPYERGRYALNDWAASADRAFNTQFLAPSRALAAYTAPQGLASNMSSMAGQAADTITGNIIPTVTSQNVGIFNQFSAQEQQRKDAVDDYNAKAQVARDEGRARTEQMYQQELSDYLTNYAKQYGKAWVNRYKWNDQGYMNPNLYKDPRTGRTIFRNTGGFGNVDSDGVGGAGSIGSSWNDYYKKFYDSMTNVTDPVKRDQRAARLADKYVESRRRTRSSKDPYDIYGSRTNSSYYDIDTDNDDEDETPQ